MARLGHRWGKFEANSKKPPAESRGFFAENRENGI